MNLTLSCPNCRQPFEVPHWRRETAKYCSKSCRATHQPLKKRLDPVSHFWEHVRKDESCWTWTGNLDTKGYGRLPVDRTMVKAHRFSYELHHGPLEAAACVLHRCDNPACVNPDHLWLGTRGDNNTDRHQKGRTNPRPGEAHHDAIVTEQQVREIRARHAAGERQNALAAEYGLSRTAMHSIIHRVNWRHVD